LPHFILLLISTLLLALKLSVLPIGFSLFPVILIKISFPLNPTFKVVSFALKVNYLFLLPESVCLKLSLFRSIRTRFPPGKNFKSNFANFTFLSERDKSN